MPQVLNHTVGPLGHGLMGFTWRPEPMPTEKAIETLKASINAGCTLWNAAEFYGTPEYNSLHLLKAYFTKYPEDADKLTIMIKGGTDLQRMAPDGTPEGIRRSIDNILNGLEGIKNLHIIFVIARRDHSSPFDVTLQTVQKEYIDTGKIEGVGISECSEDTVHEAVKHVKVAAAEVELSMFTPDILKNGVAAACKKYNIPIVAYSPISRGILTGQFRGAADTKHLGMLSQFPRLVGDALQHNLKLVEQVESLASKKGCTPAQLAINWVRALGHRSDLPEVIPIPGSTTVERVQENSKVIEFSAEELKTIDDLVNNFEAAGGRYPDGAHVEC